jgi:uncharacterized RDD family membrane protein YckC
LATPGAPKAPTPPGRRRTEAARDIPALRRRETWKDEVKERVRSRRRERGVPEPEDDLPLFRGSTPPREPTPPVPPDGDEVDHYAQTERVPVPDRVRSGAGAEDDLPLRPDRAGEGEEAEADSGEWPGPGEPSRDARAVERPAAAGERALAATLDLLLLALLWAVVVYFASRAGRASLAGLGHAWLPLTGYLAFLGLAYATYFTGTTGQTPGKLARGLRVVDTAGHPPGYLRAAVRAALGVAGIALACAGLLPIAFDPARRALHDRLLGTRVVRG